MNWVAIGAIAPTMVVACALWLLYLCASSEGLEAALRARTRRALRTRSNRYRSGRTRYRPRFKMSQDGKGGRSANS